MRAVDRPTINRVVEQTYVERLPIPALADVVRTVWIQRTGTVAYRQLNLPTGGVELQCVLGELPRLVGPLTQASTDVLEPFMTIVGARFWPGAAAPFLGLPLDELTDLTVRTEEVWRGRASRLAELLADAPDPEWALDRLQRVLLAWRRRAPDPDRLTAVAVRRLMPWRPIDIADLSTELTISHSQLRRRFLVNIGVGPKTLQRALRFQGYLALAQATASTTPPTPSHGTVADLAADVGYADHAHLSRECRRMTGVTPHELLGGKSDRCQCGHDHAASYGGFLAERRRQLGRL